MGRLIVGVNDLATVNPKLAAEWDSEKNGDLKPSDVMSGSDKLVWWKCQKGHEWKAKIYRRGKRSDGCPYCSNHRLLVGYNDLATVSSKIAAEWNYARNGNLKPSDIKFNSRNKVWWRCSEGHEWEAAVSKRAIQKTGCPYCLHHRVRTREEFISDLYKANPTIKLIGSYRNTQAKTCFECTRCGNKWEAKPNSILNGSGCPRCAKTGTSRMEQFVCVALEKLFGEENVKNRDRQSIGMELDIVYGPYAWELGSWAWHGTARKIERDREKRCRCKEKGIELFTVYDSCKGDIPPDVLKECLCFDFDLWSETDHKTLKRLCTSWAHNLGRNIDIDSFDWTAVESEAVSRCRAISESQFTNELDIVSNSSIALKSRFICLTGYVLVECRTCGTEWKTKPFLLLNGHGCPKCARKRAVENRTGKTALRSNRQFLDALQAQNNHFSSEEFLVISPYAGCDKPIACRCNICGHGWTTTPSTLLRKNTGCPACGHKAGGRKLAKTKLMSPDDFAERLSLIQPNITLLEPYKNARTKILVRCDIDGYTWETLPSTLSRGSGCPVCCNNVVMAGVNDLATTNPTLSSEWDYTRNGNLKPTEVMGGSCKRVWWKCPVCGHEWQQQIVERRRNKYLCPKCHMLKSLGNENPTELQKALRG